MPDSRFFKSIGPCTVGELAGISNAEILEKDTQSKIVKGVSPIGSAGPDEISFLDNRLYIEEFKNSTAGACVVHPDQAKNAPEGMILLLSTEPYLAFAKITNYLYPEQGKNSDQEQDELISKSATIGANTIISPGVFIGQGAHGGADCKLGPNSVIGDGVILGDGCHLGPAVTIQYSIVGCGVSFFAGSRIGEQGFGFASSVDGHLTVPQLGRVIVGDNTEIGANSTIDRGSASDTIIGNGCRIDNLVQIGHNVVIGNGCVIVAQVGIAGSTHLGDNVLVGGQVGIAGHLKIGDGVQIAAQSGVMNDLKAGKRYGGSPAVPMKQWAYQAAMLRSMGRKKVKKNG